ncbi:protease pro-enzyme activation domain-containing protein [Acidicapsa dinghuensis]|uniref:Protease pro-enzyme activation domain-containing protein n=1 Tax=Acidicapsa dinghuensis TaxID=2218256 RepID=A0ABW1EAD4_9BACT|nr:protease pro-enzyme activation domain-containing protein [Acidicapsa dinghuensis]
MTHSVKLSPFSVIAPAVFFLLFAINSPAIAQSAPLMTAQARITHPIVDSDQVVLEGNVHPLAQARYDLGIVTDATPLNRMVLVLGHSSAQQADLNALTAAQQDPASPLYHQWLTPHEFGSRFGASESDVAQIATWLAAHGFLVEPVPAGRSAIVFSGTAGQVAEAFHTEMHHFNVRGAIHLANVQDPEIPQAMAGVVQGILSLHDFRRTSSTHRIAQVAQPQNTQGSVHYLFPADYATIYNLNPLYTAGENGSGVSIAIVGRSDINLSDISAFRSGSGLTANQPSVVLEGSNPGLVSGDQDESTLDVEWSGATAPGASVTFVVGASTATTDGVDLSAQYIVNHKTADIVSTSYGSCEAYMGASELVFYNNLWQQAAAEGMTSFVSSGDSGAAGCNSGSSTTGMQQGVNGLCSSPYSTCVGGTEFNEGSNTAAYWSSTNGSGGGSALSYIPEKVWNESASDGGSGLWASTGGESITYAQPTWQQGIAGASSGGKRAVPDIALTAASHDGYLINENGSWWVIAGTSAASPSFAGIMAVVEQKLGGTGQGNVNPTLYSMASSGQSPFHPTPTGNNSVPGVTGFNATGTVYNLATGLGSVNANSLAGDWPSGGTNTAKGFTLKASASSESLLPGKAASLTVATSATSGFTGTISFKAIAPSGVTVAFSPANVSAGASTTATITVSSTATASVGSIVITGTSVTMTATATVSITVAAKPTLAIALGASTVQVTQGASGAVQVTTTIGGTWSGAVSLSLSGLPTGVTASWTNGSFSPSGDGSVASTLTLRSSTTAAVSASRLEIVATGDGLTAQAPLSLQVTAAPAVTLALSPASMSMQSMSSATVTATVTPVGGVSFASSASSAIFTVTGLPGGITGSWSTPTLTAAGALQAKLTLTGSVTAASTSTQPRIAVSVPDSVSGKSYAANAVLVLNVTRVQPTLTLASSTGKVAMVQGQSGTAQITVTTGGSFNGSVMLSATGMPLGMSATWSSNSLAKSGSTATQSVLTLKASTGEALSSSTIRITATGDGISAAISLIAQVTAAPAVSAAISPAQITVQPTAMQTIDLTLTPIGGVKLTANTSDFSFSVQGLPDGVTAVWGTPTINAAGAAVVPLGLVNDGTHSGNAQVTISGTARDAVSGTQYSFRQQLILAALRPAVRRL